MVEKSAVEGWAVICFVAATPIALWPFWWSPIKRGLTEYGGRFRQWLRLVWPLRDTEAVAAGGLAVMSLILGLGWHWYAVPVAGMAMILGAMQIRAARLREISQLATDCGILAGEMRAFLAEQDKIRKQYEAERFYTDLAFITDHSIRGYDDRFKWRVRRVAKQFRQHGAITTDIFFRYVADGVAGEHDIFQVAAGLERLADQLPEEWIVEQDSSPLEKFEAFVSDILTVTKDEVKKLEAEERAIRDALRAERAVADEEPC